MWYNFYEETGRIVKDGMVCKSVVMVEIYIICKNNPHVHEIISQTVEGFTNYKFGSKKIP